MLGKGLRLRLVMDLRLVDRDAPRRLPSSSHRSGSVRRCPAVPHREQSEEATAPASLRPVRDAA